MDIEQLNKRIQWVEEERRKEKDTLAFLENRVVAFEGSITGFSEQMKELASEITRLTTIVQRMDNFDNALLQQRTETRRSLDEISKEISVRMEESDKLRQVQVKPLENSLVELKKDLDAYTGLEKAIQLRIDEEMRLRRLIDETRAMIQNVRIEEEEYTRTVRLLEDGRRQDAKRIVDLQGEVAALRKRADDARGQLELINNTLRKNEARITEFNMVESERKEAINSFLDRQNLQTVERDRVWNEWQSRFSTIEKQAIDTEERFITLDSMQRDVHRAQGVLDELSQRVERRINELTEVQRLSEERFRQEWVTFRADDQKRWTNYSLTQEEQRNEMLRQFERMSERVTHLEDGLQEVQDLIDQTNDTAAKRLQTLLESAHEWVTDFERIVRRSGS
jgi:chromosome segregation ATPase